MLIIRFLRFLAGYVCFTAAGGFTERFVNLCTLNRIPLWNMKKHGDTLYARTSIDGYKSIRQSAHRSGVKLRLERKCGLPFFLERNRSRRGIVIGFAVAMLVVYLLSCTVWTVSVEGNKNLSKAEILSVFEELGVKKGAFTSKVRKSDAAEKAEKLIPELLWASVNVRGSRVEIVVCERTDAPEFPETSPCNIIAAEDGVIVAVQAEIGKQTVFPGDAVVKGDLLISGVTQNLDMSANLKSARGNVIAQVSEKTVCDCRSKTFYTQSYFKTRYVICFFGLRIPLGFSGKGDFTHSTESCLDNGKITLPAGVITERSYSCETGCEIPENARPLVNADLYAEKYYELCRRSDIKSEEFTLSGDSLSSGFTAEIKLEKDIGMRQEILVENQG